METVQSSTILCEELKLLQLSAITILDLLLPAESLTQASKGRLGNRVNLHVVAEQKRAPSTLVKATE